ncbi:LysE family translocator [Candidatus Liberibacter americanus]|uniref:Putative threonine efflux protein n=1 Tax=Candidatus Liberibacter americanus str. Sao Paulo TaxID=1261131 RepID=U6B8G0_9HYPH|nr:LysE family translocator [Candidatus Liberibacter americanus]AHA28151.1 Putative threonine efflux protein [Candidatus Liberibacter americanus str. Sao Paulo]EMS35937.1 homoserine/homoserine lactoneefflux protein [Candidatus Liberibacter americanus PW_SP]
MSFENWLSFLLFAFIITSLPGPGCILTINHSIQHGWKPTLMLILGQELAVFTLMFLVNIGLKSVFDFTTVMLIVKILGSIWLVYTAWNVLNSPVFDISIDSIPKTSNLSRFLLGFITDITNVKAIALFVSMLPAYLDNRYPMCPQITITTMTMVAMDTMVLLFYSAISSRLRLIFRSSNFVKMQNRIFAVALLIIAIKVIL